MYLKEVRCVTGETTRKLWLAPQPSGGQEGGEDAVGEGGRLPLEGPVHDALHRPHEARRPVWRPQGPRATPPVFWD